MTDLELKRKEHYEAIFGPVCDLLERYDIKYIVHTAREEKFRDLSDSEYCCGIEIINPFDPDYDCCLYIDDDVAFYYGEFHRHFDVWECHLLSEEVTDLLNLMERNIKTFGEQN